MSIWVRSIRWALATLAACLGFIVGFLVVARVVMVVGHPSGSDFQWLIYGGTVLAVVTGSVIAPRDQRQLFAKMIVTVLLIGTLASLVADLARHAFDLVDLYTVGGVVLGGFSAVRCARNRPLRGVET